MIAYLLPTTLCLTTMVAQEEEIAPGIPIEIELTDDLPLLDGHGAGVELRLASGDGGLIVAFATSNELDPILRLEAEDGSLLGEDDNGGGGTTALVQVNAVPSREVWITAAAAAPGQLGVVRVLLHRFPPLTEEHRQSLAKIRRLTTSIRQLASKEESDPAREQLRELVDKLLPLIEAGPHSEIMTAVDGAVSAGIHCNDPEQQRRLLDAWLPTLDSCFPPGHRSTEKLRQQFAIILTMIGDFERAHSLMEESCASLSKTLAPTDTLLLSSRGNLAEIRRQCGGDSHESILLLEQTIAAFQKHLPANNDDLNHARLQLGAAWMEVGDFAKALVIFESIRANWNPTSPGGVLAFSGMMQNLAVARQHLGDSTGALEIKQQLYDEAVRTLPKGHVRRQNLAVSLSSTLTECGNTAAAREMLENACLELEQTRPPDDLLLIQARMNLAFFKHQSNELEGLLELDQSILKLLSEKLLPTHPLRLVAEFNLAIAMRESGAVDEAMALLDRVLTTCRRIYPEGHPDLQNRRAAHCLTLALGGNLERSRSLLLEGVRAAKEQAGRTLPILGFRGFNESNRESALLLDLLLSLRDPAVSEERATLEELSAVAAFRGLIDRRARLALRAEELALEDSSMRAKLRDARLARTRWLSQLQSSDATSVEQLPSLRAAMERADEQLMQALSAEDVTTGPINWDTSDLLQRLTDEEAIVVSADFTRYLSPEKHCRPQGRAVAFFVLAKGFPPQRIDGMAPLDLDASCAAWRESLERERSEVRGVRPLVKDKPAQESSATRVLTELLAPLWPRIPARTKRLLVCTEHSLASIPWEALTLDGNSRVGDRWRVTYLESPASLSPRASRTAEPSLLVLGGIDYGAAPGGATQWSELPGTLVEAKSIHELWRAAHPERRVELLTSTRASRNRFVALAPEFRYVHLATHAFCASNTAWISGSDSTNSEPRLSALEHEALFEPGLLSGIVFAGANLPAASSADSSVLSAAELSSLDLSHCELAVLSACDTNVGERHFGEAVSGLNRALHLAGVRNTITSLWKVEDAGAEEFFRAFYQALVANPDSVQEAFSFARESVRAHGLGPSVWAAFVLYETR